VYGYEIALVANISATRGSCSCDAIALVLAAGEALQTPLPIASLLWDRFLRLLADGGAGLEWSAVGALSAGRPPGTARIDDLANLHRTPGGVATLLVGCGDIVSRSRAKLGIMVRPFWSLRQSVW
jgi:hypothetical protein